MGSFWAKIKCLKSHSKALGLSPKQIWNRSFKWSTKHWFEGLQRYQRSKLELGKNVCQLGRLRLLGFELGWSADIFLNLQLWLLISLQPLDQNQCLVLHLKDLLHICLEAKAQGFWVTFKVLNLGSKQPYFNSAYVVRVPIFSFTTVCIIFG